MLTIRTMLDLNPNILHQIIPMFSTPNGTNSPNLRLRDIIYAECGDLRPVYDDPHLFKYVTDIWVQTNRPFWSEIAKTYCYDYDPISNYDRTEVFEDVVEVEESGTNSDRVLNSETGRTANTHSIASSEKSAENHSETVGGNSSATVNTSARSESNGTANGSTTSSREETENAISESETMVAGFNDSTLTTSGGSNSNSNNKKNATSNETHTSENLNNDSKTESGKSVAEHLDNSEGNRSGTVARTESGEQSVESTKSGENESSGNFSKSVKTTNRKSGKISGNIGVTTSQQMIMSERELWRDNIYRYISEDFKQKFCVMVYF